MTTIENLDNARLYFEPADPGACWPWTGYITDKGYGGFNTHLAGGRRSTTSAHRAVYTLLVGPIPSGCELDHTCRVRHCVNPAHLEPVTHRVNVRRAAPFNRGVWGATQLRKTHCPQGHPYDDENTYHYGGRRACRACRKAAMDRYYARLRGAA